ncbi:MAG: CDP-glycerol glycerophosphotransferase family protein [Methanobacterium sp.]|nr:CDP-glycerol glycerophosphotransferase family protein [Methanobacterium sp.]
MKNKDIILHTEKINISALKEFNTYTDYFLAVLEDKTTLNDGIHLKLVNLYYATPKGYLKLRISAKDKGIELLERAEHKTLFERFSKEEKMDNNLIFFESFNGQSYSNSPKYIYEKMLEMGYGDKYTFVWSYKGDLEIPGNPIIVNGSNTEYFKYLAGAKYWVNNSTFPVEQKQKKGIYIQTWHGTPLKRLGFDIQVKNPKINWHHLNKESKNWNFLISANRYSTNIFKRAFKFNNKILEVGYPSNDIFYSKDDEFKRSLKEKFICTDKKIILYAPKFRDDDVDENGNYYFNMKLDLKKLYDKFKDEYVLIIKTHYIVSNLIEINENIKDFVYNFSDYDDIHELFLISDILITDYSSVFFDFAHSKNPILYFVPDFERYKTEVRGFYIDMEEDLPGPIIRDNDKLIWAIENIEDIKKEFKDSYEVFYEKYCSIGQGNASKKVVDAFINRWIR